MATRKKTAPESEPLQPAERVKTARPAAPAARSRKAAPGTEPGAGKLSAKTTSSAATHKAPARKPAVDETLQTPAFDTALHHQEISREAYFNWLRRGCPHGSAQEDWLAAVAFVRARIHTR